MSILKEQQEKLEDTDRLIKGLYSKPPPGSVAATFFGMEGNSSNNGNNSINSPTSANTEARLKRIEKDLEEMRVFMHGMGNEDSSILHAQEMTGYMAFQTSALGVVGAISFDENGEEQPQPTAASLTVIQEGSEDFEDRDDQGLPLESDQDQLDQTKQGDEGDSVEVNDENKAMVEEDDDQREGDKGTISKASFSNQLTEANNNTEEGTAGNGSQPGSQPSSRPSSRNTSRSISRPSSRAKTPAGDTMSSDFSKPPPIDVVDEEGGNASQRGGFVAAVREAGTPPAQRKSNNNFVNRPQTGDRNTNSRPSGLVQVEVVAGGGNGQGGLGTDGIQMTNDNRIPIQVNLSQTSGRSTRRRMTLKNLPFLSKGRLTRIVKELRRRGNFLRISRELLEDARKRYANRSLKQKMEYIEMDISRLRGQIGSLRDQSKRNTMMLKERSVGDRDAVLLDHIEVFLRVVNQMGGVERLASTMEQTERHGRILRDLKEDGMFSANDMERLKKQIAKEQDVSMREVLGKESDALKQELCKTLTSKSDIDNMLTMPEVINTRPGPRGLGVAGLASARPNDQNNVKLVAMINHAIATVHERLDSFEKYFDRQLQEQMEKHEQDKEQLLHGQQGLGGAGEYFEMKASQYTDERVNNVVRYIEQKLAEIETKRGEMTDEMALLRMKMEAIDAKMKEENASENPETLRKDAAAIRELQRRVANIPVDKLIEDLKAVRKDLRTRAVATEVQEKITTTEDGLRSLLGENVVGLRSLLYEVFRHIQSKADRDDIKHLITAKLMQMEKEIVRREEDMMKAASVTRCLSCGQSTQHLHSTSHATNSTNSTGTVKPAGAESPPRTSSPPPQQGSLVLDDELSEHPSVNQYSAAQAEQVYSLLTGQAGLKPILPQHVPLQPVKEPYQSHGSDLASRASTANPVANKHRGKVDKIPDPVYRKARLNQHMKEMVKVSATSLQSQGFDLNNNPLYVLDSQEGGPMRSVGSPLVVTDHSNEPPLTNPFTDLTQPLSYTSLPRSAAQFMGKELITSRSLNTLGGGSSTSSKAARTANNVILPDITASSAKLHNGYL
eukprot:gene5405-5945_t